MKPTTKHTIRILGLAVAAMLSIGACMAPTINPVAQSGTLWISLDSASVMTVVPDLDMNPVRYDISGVGPEGQTFSDSSTEPDFILEGLARGTWTITVTAVNNLGITVGSGSDETYVYTAKITPLSLTIVPVSGLGTISLVMRWDDTLVASPSIDATLTHPLGTQTDLTFSVDAGGTATYERADVDDGYYTLNVNLLDGGTAVAGLVETVRVLAGHTTALDHTFGSISAGTGDETGDTDLTITTNLRDPLDIDITGGVTELAQGTDVTLTASVSNYTGDVSYTWYVDGTYQSSGATLTIGSLLSTGYHRIDVTAYTADGTQGGSASQELTVTTN